MVKYLCIRQKHNYVFDTFCLFFLSFYQCHPWVSSLRYSILSVLFRVQTLVMYWTFSWTRVSFVKIEFCKCIAFRIWITSNAWLKGAWYSFFMSDNHDAQGVNELYHEVSKRYSQPNPQSQVMMIQAVNSQLNTAFISLLVFTWNTLAFYVESVNALLYWIPQDLSRVRW